MAEIKDNTHQRMYEVIDMMRFPLIYLVVVIHMIGFATPKVHLSTNPQDIYVFITEMISHNLANIAVPFFFLTSGYFFFLKLRKWEWNKYGDSLKKRIKTLLIPYLFANILIVFIGFSKDYSASLLGVQALKENIPSLYDIFWGMPADYPLWYVRDLMCAMVLSPVLYFLIEKTQIGILLLLFFAYFVGLGVGITGLGTPAFLYFTLGGFIAIKDFDLLDICRRLKWISYIFAPVLLLIATLFSGTDYYLVFQRFFTVVGIIAIVNIFNYLFNTIPFRKYLRMLSAPTFFIYIVHEMYIINWLKGGFQKLPFSHSFWGMLIGYFVIPIICVAICLALYYFLERFLPRFLAVLTGGRLSSHT